MEQLVYSKKEYDRMIDHTLRTEGPGAMVDGVERRNEARRQQRLREQKNRREAIVSNLALGGIRGQLRGAMFDNSGNLQPTFFDKIWSAIAKMFEKKKPPAGKYKWAYRNGKNILISWPSHLTPDELAYALKYHNCQLESGA